MANGHGGRRPGTGQPKKYGGETRVARVPKHLSQDKIIALVELEALLDTWEEEIVANTTSPRYYFAKKMLDEMRALGF
jgi:hypothetical protein